ncbi:MAG: hypothetical protein B9S32_06455 [Verrucomicrobia bacterium Tous-C9LFEB]|nr:MAG: hypothetical protein B9S32_06455 [Verrucomicrobia bacterium Tous-C9LFEB]
MKTTLFPIMALAILGACTGMTHAATLVTYTFPSGAATPTTVDSSVTASSVSLGTTSAGNFGFSSIASNFYSRLQSPPPNPTYQLPTTLAGATTGQTYIEFTLTPQAAQTLNLSNLKVDLSAQNTSGAAAYYDYTFYADLQVTINGVMSDLGSVSYTALAGAGDTVYPASNKTFDLSSSTFQGVTDPITFRLLVYRDPASTSNYYETIRLDNISVNTVPEPTSIALMILGCGLLLVSQRQRALRLDS